MWLPIESAPTGAMPEGALVWDGHHISIAYPTGIRADIWVDEYANEVFPTHWRPLPEPPPPENSSRIPEGEDAW